MIPGVNILGASYGIASLMYTVGYYRMYTLLRDHTSSKGTRVVFKWAPPSVKAYKR